jgi:hypothetical protein
MDDERDMPRLRIAGMWQPRKPSQVIRQDKSHSEAPTFFGLKFEDILFDYVRPYNLCSPKFDRYGVPFGEEYSAFLRARSLGHSTRSTFAHLEFQGRVEDRSMEETVFFHPLLFTPTVLSFREQYPVYEDDDFRKAKLTGRNLLRPQVMTLDLVIDYPCLVTGARKSHVVSIKNSSYLDERDLARENAEIEVATKRGWTWELRAFDWRSQQTKFLNCFLLYRHVNGVNVKSFYAQSKQFAELIKSASLQSPMDSVLRRVGRRFGCDQDFAYILFSVAVKYGFLRVDHSFDLRPHLSVNLLRSEDHRAR